MLTASEEAAAIVAHTIPLTRGMVALVDACDYKLLARWKWHALKIGRTYYAVRNKPRGEGRGTIYMHRVILNAPERVLVDHANGNGLDNRRSNLRLATKGQNAINTATNTYKTPASYSRYRGVTWHKKIGRWEAQIHVRGEKVYLGVFDDEAEAARAYDRVALHYFGEFARTNFPKKEYEQDKAA